MARTDWINKGIGLGTWGLITLPLWGAYFFPLAVAWIVVAFNGYWLLRSAQLGLGAIVGYVRLRKSERTDWLTLASTQPGFDSLHHLVLIPTFKESDDILSETLDHIAAQEFPRERISVVLAFEARDSGAPARAKRLLDKYRPTFGHVWALFHIQQPGDMPGKSSNLAWAAPRARILLARAGIDPATVLATICDADSRLHPKYFSNLAYSHLSDPGRADRLYQPALLFHANLNRLLPPLRATNSAYSAWSLARLNFGQRLVLQSTYSLPLELCHAVGYWDPEVIPEDSRICFKILQHRGERAQVKPIFLPVRADAAEGATPWETVKAHYQQIRRWAWGASDVPYVLSGLVRRDAPRPKILPALGFVEDHLTWPTHWFLITIGNKALPFLAPAVAASPEGVALLATASFLLSLCLPFLFMAAGVDLLLRGGSGDPLEWMGELFGWALMPAITLVLTALPALDAHTRMLFGRRLGYQVTPKFAR